MRDTLGSLAVQLLETERSPSAAMSAWLALGDAPLRFTIDQDLELQAADQTKATIRYTRYPLEAREIRQHLTAGMYATRLGLTWNDRISFVLTEKLQIKRVEFLAIDKDSAPQQSQENEQRAAQEQFEIDFMLMAGELNQLLADLGQALGEQPERQAAAESLRGQQRLAGPAQDRHRDVLLARQFLHELDHLRRKPCRAPPASAPPRQQPGCDSSASRHAPRAPMASGEAGVARRCANAETDGFDQRRIAALHGLRDALATRARRRVLRAIQCARSVQRFERRHDGAR